MALISKLPVLIRQHEIKHNRLLNQKIVAEESNVSRATVNKLAQGGEVARVDGTTVTRLCRYFDCTLNDLFEITDDNELEVEVSG